MKPPSFIKTPISSVVTFFCLVLCSETFFSTPNAFALESYDCKFPAIFNFGDSNSDTGAFSAAFRRLPLPYGRTYFRMPSGRSSDGRLTIDFMAKNLGLPFLSAYLDSLGANYSHGANFAVTYATIKPLGGAYNISGLILSPLYLALEYNQFLQFKPRSQTIKNRGSGIFMGLVPEEEYFSRALYTIDIGQNDIVDAFFFNMTVEQVKALVPGLVNTISSHIKALYILRARSFWIHNTAPIGCLAYVLAGVPISADQYDTAGCGKPFNNAAQYFNQLLKEEVVKLRTELPSAAITYVDIYSIKYSFFSHPEKYGFVQPLVACCGTGGKYNYNSSIPCTRMNSCLNPSKKVNWDGSHFTEAANKAVFDQISTGKFSDPAIPPRLACHRSTPAPTPTP